MTLLDKDIWHGRLYSGEWITGSGGEYDSVEPATGAVLGQHSLLEPGAQLLDAGLTPRQLQILRDGMHDPAVTGYTYPLYTAIGVKPT
jgi:hypothetical protein